MDDFLSQLSPDEVKQLKKLLGVKAKQEAKITGDVSNPLKEPVFFFNDRYPNERFYVNNKLKQFADGQFTAKTENERDAVRKMGAYIFEGRDAPEGRKCNVCQRVYYNTDVFLWHLNNKHAIA